MTEQFDPSGQFTNEQLHILYCLHILELTPEETAARVWPGKGEWGRKANEAYVRWVVADFQEQRASGEIPPFPADEFLEWTGFPPKAVDRPN